MPLRVPLPPDVWMLQVSTPPLAPRWVEVKAPRDGVESVSVRLCAAADRSLALRGGPTRASTEGFTAELFRGPRWIGRPERRVLVLQDGHLLLPGLLPEPYLLRLTWGPWLSRDYLISDGLEAPEVLELPEVGAIQGRVLFDAGADPERITIKLGSHRTRLQVDGQGRFDAAQVSAGAVPFLVRSDRTHAIQEGGFLIDPGQTIEPVLDLRSLIPGPQTVRLFADGDALSGATLHLLPEDGGPAERLRADRQGWVYLDLPPGSYLPAINSTRADWAWGSTTPIVVERGSNEGLRLEVSLVERAAIFRDHAGKLLQNAVVGFETGMAPYRSTIYRTTDGEGKLLLGLPVGPVRFLLPPSAGTQDSAQVVIKPWVAGDEPVAVTFRRDD